MSTHTQCILDPATAAKFCRTWSTHVDALDRHLATDRWAMAVIGIVLLAYPIVRIMIPAVLHGFVPDVVRTVLHLI